MIRRLLTPQARETIAPAIRRVLRGMRLRYVVALLSVAILSSVAYVGSINIVETEARSATVINISGRQRMLSQRIPLLARKIVETDRSDLREQALAEFSASLSLMEASHDALINGDPNIGLERLQSSNVRALLFNGERGLDSQLKSFFATAQKISVRATGSRFDPVVQNDVQALARMGEDILPLLDGVVWQFEYESDAAIERLKRWQIGILATTLVVLMAEGLLIFWPLERN